MILSISLSFITGGYCTWLISTAASSAFSVQAAALSYLTQRRWSILAVARNKRPYKPWERFQSSLVTPEEAQEWYRQWPLAGVGIVTGSVSALFVVDVDPRAGGDLTLGEWAEKGWFIPDGPQAKTGGGGCHFYLALPTGGLPTCPALGQGIDLKAEGSYVVAPPSSHPSGGLYQWYPDMGPDLPLPEAPAWLLALVQQRRGVGASNGTGNGVKAWHLVSGPIPDHTRNITLTRIAGWLRLYHPVPVVEVLLLAINDARCQPPLDADEVRTIAQSVGRYPTPGAPGHPLAVVPSFTREVVDGQ